MTADSLIDLLKNHAAKDELGDMLGCMQEYFSFWEGQYTEGDFLQWAAQLHQMERENRLGIVSAERYQLDRNKLRYTLIEVALKAGAMVPEATRKADGDVHFDQAVDLVNAYKFEAAEYEMDKALSLGLEHRDLSTAHAIMGRIYGEQNRWQEAISEHQKALELNPENARNWTNLGVAYRRTAQYEKAASCYDKALAINPDYDEAHTSLAALHLTHTMDFAAAIKHLNRALELDPGDAIAHANMAIAQASIGKFDAAETYLKKAVLKGYRNTEACRATIDNLRAGQ